MAQTLELYNKENETLATLFRVSKDFNGILEGYKGGIIATMLGRGNPSGMGKNRRKTNLYSTGTGPSGADEQYAGVHQGTDGCAYARP